MSFLYDNYRILDLTHTIDGSIPTWSGGCGFFHEVKRGYDQGVYVLSYKMHAGVGTHMDAQTHFFKNGKGIADISLQDLIVSACVIDVTKHAQRDYFIDINVIESFEKKYGKIPKKSLVIGYTGWQNFWNDPEKYRAEMRFPGFSEKAAQLLLTRDIVGIGIDTLSPDGANTNIFPVHECILGAGKYIIENLTNLDQLPPVGALVIALPLKIRVGAESAIRAIALVHK